MAETTPSLRQRLGGRSLYLIGMMGSGKSSTGRPLAERLGYGFVDADAVIEQVTGSNISEIFERDGEDHFRDLETQVLSLTKASLLCSGKLSKAQKRVGKRWKSRE